MKTSPDYDRRLRIWETNYGRDCGWQIERNGDVIAILSEPRYEEMFWESYQMEIVTEDLELRGRLLTTEFWAVAEAEGVRWKGGGRGDTPLCYLCGVNLGEAMAQVSRVSATNPVE